MVKIKFAAFAAVMMAALSIGARAQQPAAGAANVPDGRVVVINTNAFPAQIGELKQKYDQVEGQFKTKSQELQTLQQTLQAKENERQTKGASLTPEKLRELEIEIEDVKKRGQRGLEDLRQDYAKAIEVTTKPVRDKLYKFLENYASQRGIIMIVDLPGAAQTGSLAYWNPSADVTDDFIKEYNKANPVPGAAAPAPQPGAQKPAAGKP